MGGVVAFIITLFAIFLFFVNPYMRIVGGICILIACLVGVGIGVHMLKWRKENDIDNGHFGDIMLIFCCSVGGLLSFIAAISGFSYLW